MERMNILNVENVTKIYGDKVLLKNAGLGINEGDKIGIVGVNGCGKSTFLKLLSGLEQPDEGQIIKNKQADMSYLDQNMEFEPDDTILSYVVRGKESPNANWNVEGQARGILKKLFLTDETLRVGDLSGGEKKRVALARALLFPSKILILDEPTNHLDNRMVMWLEEYLIKYQGILIMVTHDRYFLDRVTNKIVELDKGSLYTYESNYSGFLELKRQRLESEMATYNKAKNLLRTELEWVRRGAKARSTKQKARLERFEQLKQMQAPELEQKVEMSSVSSRLGKKTIEIEGLSKVYGQRTLIKNFTYYTLRNDRVGIVGENGCGKTTLLRLILGQEEPDSGSITIGETVRIGYFSQMAEELNEEQRVIDCIKDVAEYIQTEKGLTSASQMCERFLFGPEIQYNPIEKLSGGEKRRLNLLKVLMTAPNVLILDEPTNDLDIATLTILEDYLDSFDGIVIAVSHDRYFLDRIADRILAFEPDGQIRKYEGDYSVYLDKVGTKENLTVDIPEEKQDKNNWKPKEKKLKFTYMEKKEYETIEDEMAVLEEKIEALECEMSAVSTDFVKLNQLMSEKAEMEKLLNEKMERWMYLEELAEKIANQ